MTAAVSKRAGIPQEIATGVYWLAVGKGFMRANVYFVGSASSWCLIDAGSPGCAPVIQEAATSLFGRESLPVSILLTHDHPDHIGAARELAEKWRCPVCVHPDELPMVTGDMTTFQKYGHPLDRWVILPCLRLLGKNRAAQIVARTSLKDVVRAFDPGAPPPGLAEWEVIFTPGHTPGHVSFFRLSGRVLLSGDALLTANVGSPVGFLLQTQTFSGPPWFVTRDRRAARSAIRALGELEPLVVAGGHGIPMTGRDTPRKLHAFVARMR